MILRFSHSGDRLRVAVDAPEAIQSSPQPAPSMEEWLGDAVSALKNTNSLYLACIDMAVVNKLLHTRYRVNDIDRTVKFYTEILGLTEVQRHKSPRGGQLVFLKAPESDELIEICWFPSSGPVQVQADLTHLAFEVDSLEEFGRHIALHGLQFSDGPHMNASGGGIAFIDAPEGYEIELIQKAK